MWPHEEAPADDLSVVACSYNLMRLVLRVYGNEPTAIAQAPLVYHHIQTYETSTDSIVLQVSISSMMGDRIIQLVDYFTREVLIS